MDLPGVERVLLGAKAHERFGGFVTDPLHGSGIPFMLVGPKIAAVCAVLYVTTSLLTPAMDRELVAQVCWDHPLAFLKGSISVANDPRIVAVVFMAVVTDLYFLLR